MGVSLFFTLVLSFSVIVVSSVAYPSVLETNGDIYHNTSNPVDQNAGDSKRNEDLHRTTNSWNSDSGSVNESSSTPLKYPKKWVANLFYETLVNFTVSEDVGSSECRKQTQMYARHLENDSIWAIQMSDSWNRYPNGILVGTTHQMGVYEECINVHQPIQGKFCIPSVKLVSASGEDFTVGKPDKPHINDHAWREILGYIDNDNQINRNEVKFGVCIPDSCTASDLETSLQTVFDKVFLPNHVKAYVQVESIFCSTDKDEYPYDNGFYLTSLLLGLIFFICCFSTIYHFITITFNDSEGKDVKIPQMISIFSIINNSRNLIKYDRNNNLNIFNGLKVFSMIFVMFGHKFVYFVINPISYGKLLEMVYTNGPDFLLTSINLVDPFFYMAGYLMYVLLIPQFSKPGTNWYQIPMIFIYKYMMILPSYVVMILLTAFVIPHLSRGPFWASRIWLEADKCKTYWWANILGVSNIIDTENQCMLASWYISCLLQILVIGLIVIYIYVKNRRIGIFLILLLFSLSLVIPFFMTYIYRGWGIMRLTTSTLANPRRSFEFNYLYRSFYLRASPYFAGILAAIIVEELKKRGIKFSKFVVYAGTVVITVISMWIQLYGAVFYDVHRPYNVLEQSLYSTLSHCTWTAILFWVTMCHFITGYGPIEKLLNNRLVVPLGRLSFTTYIVNITIMTIIESKQRVTVYPSVDFIIDGWISGVFRTYITATMLYLFIEAPFSLLIKKMFFKEKYIKKDQISMPGISKSHQKYSTNE